MRDDQREHRPRCEYCRETVDPEDKRAVCLPGRGSSGWLCSDVRLDRFRRRAIGQEVRPLYGEMLSDGFRLLQLSESGNW